LKHIITFKDGIYEYLPENADASYTRGVELIKKWHGRDDNRITTILAPLAAELTTPETYIKCKEAAETYNINITTHLSHPWMAVLQVKKLHGKTPPELLNDIGVLNDHLSSAHCTYLTEKDTMLIKKSGMKILHCPRPYALRGWTAPLLKWIDIGIPVGLATDNLFHSMNETMRVALYASKFRSQVIGGADREMSYSRPKCTEILELATIKGAEIMNIDKEVGSLVPGKKADVITFDMSSPHMTPTMDPISSLVFYGTSADIDIVMVNGKILKENGKLKNLDMNKILKDSQIKMNEIWNKFFEDNIKIKKLWKKNISFKKGPK